jgi:hypothetical protein
MKRLLPLLLITCCVNAAETGYRQIHPDGTVEFSDQPLPGGEEIELREAPTIQFVPPSPPGATAVGRQQGAAGSKDSGAMAITITSPLPQQTVWFSDSGITASVAVTPALQGGQKIVIRVDGKRVASGTGSSFNLGLLYRGSHTLTATIVTASDEVISASPPVTFHVRQHSTIKRTDPLTPPSPDELLTPP